MLRGFSGVYSHKELINFTLKNMFGPHSAKKEIEADENLKRIYKYSEKETIDLKDKDHVMYLKLDIIMTIIVKICKPISTISEESLFCMAILWGEKFPYVCTHARNILNGAILIK
jgi:hypothetical protein